MTEDELEATLYEAATSAVQRRGLQLSDSGLNAIRQITRDGARTLIERDAHDEVDKAIEAIDRIVSESAQVHYHMRTITSKGMLSAFEIEASLRSLCPIFPIC